MSIRQRLRPRSDQPTSSDNQNARIVSDVPKKTQELEPGCAWSMATARPSRRALPVRRRLLGPSKGEFHLRLILTLAALELDGFVRRTWSRAARDGDIMGHRAPA
jgi:hypothetical protein